MTSPNVPVDGRGLDWPRKVANAVNGLFARLAAAEAAAGDAMSMAAGFGFIDYTDNDAPDVLTLPADVETEVERDLAPSEANRRLRGPWANHDFWDNEAKLIRARALYDVVTLSFAMRIISDVANGKLTLSLVAGSLNFASTTVPLTAPVGEEESMRIEFTVPMRSAFVANGAKVMLMSTVDASLVEFSPEFYPVGYEP